MGYYRISFRARDGRRETVSLAADSREELFRVLDVRGIRALKTESIPSPDAGRRPFRVCPWRWGVVILLALSCAATGIYWLWPRSRMTKSESDVVRNPIPQTSARSSKPRLASTPRAQSNGQQVKPQDSQPRLAQSETNAMGYVIEDFILPDGAEMRRITPPKPVWDNSVDQLIAMAVSIEPGVEAPPLPAGVSDREFMKALKNPIIINSSDSSELQRLKRKVRDARNEILEVMAKTGKTFEEVLNEHRDAMNEGTALWRMAQEAFKSVRETATKEELDEYTAKVNAYLEERGARPLSIRPRQRGKAKNSP